MDVTALGFGGGGKRYSGTKSNSNKISEKTVRGKNGREKEAPTFGKKRDTVTLINVS